MLVTVSRGKSRGLTGSIQVRYQESHVWLVITEPSAEAPLPTIMLVHDSFSALPVAMPHAAHSSAAIQIIGFLMI